MKGMTKPVMAACRCVLRPRLDSVALTALGAFAVACGPEVFEEPKPQAWMLGTFTANPPGDYLDITGVYRQIILEGGRARRERVTEDGAEPAGDSVWRVVDDATFNYYSESFDDARWWEVTRSEDCSTLLLRDGEDGEEDLQPQTWYRGTICFDNITQPCPPDQAQCGIKLRLYWCEEPPPCDGE